MADKNKARVRKVKRLVEAYENEALQTHVSALAQGLTGLKVVTKGAAKYAIGKNAEGITVTHNGKKVGRPTKDKPSNTGVTLTKSQTRELFSQIFDLNAPEMFRIAFELARTDKDMLKYLIDHRLGKPATTIAGDESAPLTLIVRRGTDTL